MAAVAAASSAGRGDDEGGAAGSLVVRGDRVGCTATATAGAGTYERGGGIFASLVGTKVGATATAADSGSLPIVGVRRAGGREAGAALPDVGSIVMGRVSRITQAAATVEIVVVDGLAAAEAFSGTLRRENVRPTDIDGLKMEDCFHPGDLVLAVVASLGDARSYVLTTAREDLGVMYATSEDGEVMIPVSFDEFEVPSTGKRERRKVAKPQL